MAVAGIPIGNNSTFIAAGIVGHVTDAGKNLGKRISSEGWNEAKREVRNQTDKDTSKVIYTTITTTDAVHTLAKAPFMPGLSYGAAYVANERAKQVHESTVKALQVGGYHVEKPSDIMRTGERGLSAYGVNSRNPSGTTVSMHFESFKDGAPVGKINFNVERMSVISDYTSAYHCAKIQTKFDAGMSAFTTSRKMGLSVSQATRGAMIASVVTRFKDKDLENFLRAGNMLQKSKAEQMAYPKKLGTSVLRVATMPLQSSESMRGFHLGESTMRGALAVNKFVAQPVINLNYNLGARIINRVRIKRVMRKKGWSVDRAKKALAKADKIVKRVPFRNLTGLNGLQKKILRAPLRLISRGYAALGNKLHAKLLKKGIKDSGRATYAMMRSELLKKYAKDKLDKAAYKAGLKEARKKALEMGAKNGSKLAKVLGKFSKIGEKIGNSIVGQFFKKIFEILGKIRDFFKKIFAILGKWLLAILIAFGLFAAGLLLLNGLCIALDTTWARITGIFTLSEAREFKKEAKWIQDALKEAHQDEINEIIKIFSDYDEQVAAGDVIYSNGASENYKELWSAVSVMLQGAIGEKGGANNERNQVAFDKTDMQEIAKSLYQQTHLLTHRTYPFVENSGVDGTGIHVYLDILRDETLAYECLALTETESTDKPIIEVDGYDWANIVSSVKMALAKTGCSYNPHDNVSIIVNSEFYNMRPDGSGFVSMCLRLYKPSGFKNNVSTYHLYTRSSIDGFERHVFTGWGDLKEGDILVSENECSIYAWTVGNYHYTYSASNGARIVRTSATADSGSYKYYFRPINPGSINVMTSDYVPETEDEIEDMEIEKALHDKNPLFTNAPKLDEENNYNEEGFEVSLKATIQATIDDPGVFTAKNYEGTYYNHTLIHKTNFWGNDVDKASSLDFVRFIFAKHGIRVPVSIDSAIAEMGTNVMMDNLSIGDLIWYIPPGQTNDRYLSHVKNLKLLNTDTISTVRDDEGNVTEEVNTGEYLKKVAVPMIYMGDGKVIAYSENALKPSGSYLTDDGILQYYDNPAAIYVYKLSDLDESRIWELARPAGFTVKPIYGATTFFEGWTDSNILSLIALIYDDCWNVKKADMTKKGEFISEDEDNAKVDFSWYDPDTFVGDDVDVKLNGYGLGWNSYSSQKHYNDFGYSVKKIMVKYYDVYGVLPSTAAAIASALSNRCSTEEALLYYNIFEVLADEPTASNQWTTLYDDNSDKVTILKYKYDKEGNATSEMRTYRKYNNYEEAIVDYFKLLEDAGAYEHVAGGREVISLDSHDYTRYSDQLFNFELHGCITPEVHSKALSTKLVDDRYDESAKLRREYMENGDFIYQNAQALANKLSNTTHPEREDYYQLCLYISEYEKAINGLIQIDAEYDSRTDRSQGVINRYNSIIDSLKAAAKDAYAKYEAASAEEYVEDYTCHGFIIKLVSKIDTSTRPKNSLTTGFVIPPVKIDIEKGYCDDAGSILEHHSYSAICPNGAEHTANKQIWLNFSVNF